MRKFLSLCSLLALVTGCGGRTSGLIDGANGSPSVLPPLGRSTPKTLMTSSLPLLALAQDADALYVSAQGDRAVPGP
ncbi:MAG: hypothetical protein ACHREM_24070, partial [Polyangiales bacterium]